MTMWYAECTKINVDQCRITVYEVHCVLLSKHSLFLSQTDKPLVYLLAYCQAKKWIVNEAVYKWSSCKVNLIVLSCNFLAKSTLNCIANTPVVTLNETKELQMLKFLFSISLQSKVTILWKYCVTFSRQFLGQFLYIFYFS